MKTEAKLHILTPLHIGSGQELDPLSYVMKDNRLVLIDLAAWIEGYEKRDELIKVIESGELNRIKQYIARNINIERAPVLDRIPVLSSGFAAKYQKSIKDANNQQQAIVNFMTRTPALHRAIIPGSSIKGAIRTAIANSFVMTAGVKPGDEWKRKYEQKIFGPPTKDVMRHLKVKDVELAQEGTAIFEAVEHAVKKSKTPKGNFEATRSLCTQGKPVSFDLVFSLVPFYLKGQRVDLKFLVKSLNDFYLPKFKDEYNKFYRGEDEIKRAMQAVFADLHDLKENEALLRIGHFSHVECVTLDGVRRPSGKKINGKRIWGTTRTLAEGLLPFGWAKLVFPGLPGGKKKDIDWSFEAPEKKDSFPIHQKFLDHAGRTVKSASVVQGREVPSVKKTRKIWERVVLKWIPNRQVLEVKCSEGRAEIKGKDKLPEELVNKVVKKKKSVECSSAEVEIEGNMVRIIRINR